MHRPSESLMNEFYNIAECNTEKRLSAVANFVQTEEVEEHKDYVLGRLIAGLGSSRAASRHGFSTALVFMLKKYGADFSLDELFSIANKKLDSKSSSMEGSKGAIGWHLLCTSCFLSGNYLEETEKLIQKQLRLVSDHAFLRAAVCDSIVRLCNEQTEEFFCEHILPIIGAGLAKPIEEQTAEGLLMIIGLKSKFSKILRKKFNLPLKKNRLLLEESQYPSLIQILKDADKCLKLPLILALMRIGQENNKFVRYYRNIVEEYAMHGDESKAIIRYFDLLNQILLAVGTDGKPQVSDEQLFSIFNETLVKSMRKYSHRSDPNYRGVHLLIGSLLERFEERLSVANLEQGQLLDLIALVDRIDHGDFDTKVGCRVKFSEFLVGKLEGEALMTFIDKALTQEPWSLRRLEGSAFSKQDADTKTAILTKIVESKRSSEHDFNIVCSLIDQCFVVKFRRFHFMNVVVSESDINMLLSVAANISSKFGKYKTDMITEFRPVFTFAAIMKILSLVCPERSDKQQYIVDSKEARRCAKEFDGSIFVDLLMSVLIRKNRVHRAIVFYVFNAMISRIGAIEAGHIIRTIGKSDKQIAGDDEEEESDDDFEPITEAELEDLKRKQEMDVKEDDDEDIDDDIDSVSSDDSDEDSEKDDEVDVKLTKDVQKALGDASFLDEHDENEDYEMSDNEMAKLDEALAEAFRKNSSKEKRLQQEEFRVFRGKCLDMLNIYLTKANSDSLEIFAEQLKQLNEQFLKNGIKEFKIKIDALLQLIKERSKKEKKEPISMTASALRRVVYGTRFETSIANVLHSFPNSLYQLVPPKEERKETTLAYKRIVRRWVDRDKAEGEVSEFETEVCDIEPTNSENQLKSEKRPFKGVLSIDIERSANNPWKDMLGIPSVSTIEGCVGEKRALYLWQENLIANMGYPGFKEVTQERKSSGILFHSIIEKLLAELKETGKVTASDEIHEKCEEKKVSGYFESALSFLKTLKSHDQMCLEQSTVSIPLCYRGRFDAIVEYEGSLTVMDWKTVSGLSVKSHKNAKQTLKDLYANPGQIAAYVAAINSDPNFSRLPKICQGAIVLCYEDGREAEVVGMTEKDIQEYFELWLDKVNRFWWEVENRRPNNTGEISFVYDPREEDSSRKE
ncbi:DNA polymerase phi domain-containing protein [Ditylenchus destructor]|uniref:DNA polymerase phi domain-containing protein n=1 Tax=Ditylenchus destructor TaxID=166010 RepID=A0AAD4NBG5_9BILA|nr:DNA polymerase phi domain-containing protein [Ditylenchus destructor]